MLNFRGYVWMLEYRWNGPDLEQFKNWHKTWMPADSWYATRKSAREAKDAKEFSSDYCWEYRVVKYAKVP